MRLTRDDAMEVRGFLRARGLTIEETAALIDRHRTTFAKMLAGTRAVTGVELLEIGEKIALRTGRKELE